MQWRLVTDRPGPIRWVYGELPYYEYLIVSNVNNTVFYAYCYAEEIGVFAALAEAQQFVEMHYAVGAGN